MKWDTAAESCMSEGAIHTHTRERDVCACGEEHRGSIRLTLDLDEKSEYATTIFKWRPFERHTLLKELFAFLLASWFSYSGGGFCVFIIFFLGWWFSFLHIEVLQNIEIPLNPYVYHDFFLLWIITSANTWNTIYGHWMDIYFTGMGLICSLLRILKGYIMRRSFFWYFI